MRALDPAQIDPFSSGHNNWEDIPLATAQGLIPPNIYLGDTPVGQITGEYPLREIVYPNTPGVTDWHYDFVCWIVQMDGVNSLFPPFDPPAQNHAPPIHLNKDAVTNIVTMAVFELNGGPIQGDTSGCLIRAVDIDAISSFNAQQFGGFVDINPASLTDDANQRGFIPTEPVPQFGDAVITARSKVGPYQFSHWAFTWLQIVQAPTNQDPAIKVLAHQSPRAYACYRKSNGRIRWPFVPNEPAHDRFRPSDGRLASIAVGLSLSDLAMQTAPEVRNNVIDAAILQTSLAADAIKQKMKAAKVQPAQKSVTRKNDRTPHLRSVTPNGRKSLDK